MPILGAFALLLGFLLLDHDAAALFQSLAEDTRLRYMGGEPLSDVIMVITLVAAAGSLILMLFWPRLEAPREQVVIRQYFGNSPAAPETEPASDALRIPLQRYYLTAMAQLRRVRAYLGFAG